MKKTTDAINSPLKGKVCLQILADLTDLTDLKKLDQVAAKELLWCL